MAQMVQSKKNPANTLRIELHSHSTQSDGLYTPTQLAQRMQESGVVGWALTDHDTTSGCAEAARASKEHGIGFVPGIEISAQAGRTIHVLGLGIEPELLIDYGRARRSDRVQRMEAMATRAIELGLLEEGVQKYLLNHESPGRPHLAKALVDAGVVSSVPEAFEKYLKPGAKLYIESPWPSVSDAISTIKSAHGVSVLAHPGKDRVEEAELALWAEQGLDGVEVMHPSHTENDIARYQRAANLLGILKSASTDYHGTPQGDSRPGLDCPVSMWTPIAERLGVVF